MPQQAMSSKEKRMMEAARLFYMEDLNMREVSERMTVSYDTVRRYFSQEDMDQFKRFYSDQELFKLQQSLEQDVQDGNKLANNLLARAIQHDEAKPSTLVRASKQAQKIRERKIKMLQELGIIEKTPDKEVHKDGSGGDEVVERMQQAYRELQEQSDEKESVEAVS